jgi:hypothetical protein
VHERLRLGARDVELGHSDLAQERGEAEIGLFEGKALANGRRRKRHPRRYGVVGLQLAIAHLSLLMIRPGVGEVVKK